MRTTVRLDDDLLRDAKQLAAKTGRSLTALIEDALREQIIRHRERRTRKKVELPVFRNGRGLQPGIELDDSASLWDLADDPD
jgi:hypothetical protein